MPQLIKKVVRKASKILGKDTTQPNLATDVEDLVNPHSVFDQQSTSDVSSPCWPNNLIRRKRSQPLTRSSVQQIWPLPSHFVRSPDMHSLGPKRSKEVRKAKILQVIPTTASSLNNDWETTTESSNDHSKTDDFQACDVGRPKTLGICSSSTKAGGGKERSSQVRPLFEPF